ncbi:MAG TPA: immunoglobulin domain-containing protein [Verrucomicrobiae bacterium]|nr:immunoglobulin domain-containing protein [Verrucomicrobiae bacterium]
MKPSNQNIMESLRQWIMVAMVLLAADSGFAQTYSVVDLGAFTNSPETVNAINNSGNLAGILKINGNYRAVLYGGAWTNLGTLGGTTNTGVLGMNDALRVVGRSRLTNSTLSRAFLWTPGGTDGIASNPQMKDLGTLSGGAAAEADDINSSGQITGFSQTSKDDHAFRYSGGTMTDIGTLLGNNVDSYAASINDAGHVTGTAYYQNFGSSRAFFYNGSSMTDLGNFGWSDSYGLAINNNTNIIGYVDDSTTGYAHAFRYTTNFADLGTLGGHYSYALSINNSNLIVGGSFADAGDLIYHAFICTNSSPFDLNNLLDDSGAGWVLNEARAINDGGQIIGLGTLNGVRHAFLLAKLPPGITNQPVSQTVTVSNSVTLTVGVTGTTPLSYQWRFGGTNLAGATTNFYALNNAQPTNAGAYTIVITNYYGAVTSAVATLTVTIPVPPQITDFKIAGTNVLLSFSTMSSGNYFIEARTNLTIGAWSGLISNIAGNGSVKTATNFGGAALPECYYRVRLSFP